VTTVLLRRNADVTAVDESGRTAVDLAQSRWIRATLRHAWNDAKRRTLDAGDERPLAAATSSPRSAAESPVQPTSDAPRGKLLRPFERSRSLDQPQRGDLTGSTRVSALRVTSVPCSDDDRVQSTLRK